MSIIMRDLSPASIYLVVFYLEIGLALFLEIHRALFQATSCLCLVLL